MKAKLVLWSPMVRVVVSDDATYEDIIKAAKEKFLNVLKHEYENHIEDVIDDEECPYDEEEEEEEEAIPSDWIIGDSYEVIDQKEGHQFSIGQNVTLHQISDHNSGVFEGEDGKWWCMHRREVKHIKQ